MLGEPSYVKSVPEDKVKRVGRMDLGGKECKVSMAMKVQERNG